MKIIVNKEKTSIFFVGTPSFTTFATYLSICSHCTESCRRRMQMNAGTDATAPDGGRKIQQPHSSRVQPIFSVVPVWSAAYPFFAIFSLEKKSIPSAMHFLHMRSASECAASHRWSGQCLRCGRAWRSGRD